jgi:hypothetical protein
VTGREITARVAVAADVDHHLDATLAARRARHSGVAVDAEGVATAARLAMRRHHGNHGASGRTAREIIKTWVRMTMAETQHDIENVEAWAVVIGDMLHLVPLEHRAAVLALATANEDAERKKREANGGLLTPVAAFDPSKPGLRHWNAVMRLKSLLIQVFTRDITNNYNARDAAQILFAPHRYGTGSRALLDYIADLLPSRSSS